MKHDALLSLVPNGVCACRRVQVREDHHKLKTSCNFHPPHGESLTMIPVVTRVISRPLSTGAEAPLFQHAVIILLLMKPSLDHNNLSFSFQSPSSVEST